jgi:hypothetical protein
VGIYNYIPETGNVSSVYSVAAVLYLQFVLHVLLLLQDNIKLFYFKGQQQLPETNLEAFQH